MDFNLVVLAGRVAAPTEITATETGRVVRCLVAVQTAHPRHRLDLVPVVVDQAVTPMAATPQPGDQIWVAGTIRRRLATESGRGGIEVAARHVEVPSGPRSDG